MQRHATVHWVWNGQKDTDPLPAAADLVMPVMQLELQRDDYNSGFTVV